MRLLVLGGTHFPGRHVATAALEGGHDVATSTRAAPSHRPEPGLPQKLEATLLADR